MSRIFVPHVITDDSALGGRVIDKSLRFRSSNSANLQRSISTTGDRRTYTISFWIKRSKLGEQAYLDHYEDDANRSMHMFDASNKARLFSRMSNSTHENVYSNTLFRDTNSWYHIVWEVDTRELTAADRIKLWVNGVQDTFSSSSFPSLNGYAQVNSTNAGIRLGCNNDSGGLEAFLDGYIAEWHFLDGTAFDCTHFGYFDSQTGIWRPKRFDKSVIPNRSTRAFSGSGWTVSGGSGFSGSKPITNAYNGSIGTSNSDVANNSAGGALLTWDTSAYNLSGQLRIFCWSDGGEYDIYVNGNSGNTTKVGDTPSGSGNATWIDCGTFDEINEIQFSGTTYNTDTGLGLSGVYIAGFIVNGVHLRDNMHEYGRNGYYLDFADSSNTTATTLGHDESGGYANNFTINNMSVTAGKDDDSMIDTPTNNFPTFNLSNRSTQPTISNGNLRMYYNYKPATKTTRATFRLPKSGKYYWEWQNEESSSNPGRWQSTIGNVEELAENSVDVNAANNANFVSYSYGGSTWNGTTHVSSSWDGTTRSWYSPERAAWAVDCDSGNVWVGRVASDGTTQWWAPDGSATGNPSKLLNPTCGIDKDKTHEYAPMVCWHEGGGASSTAFAINVNFGQHSFLGTIPDGFKTLSSVNIPPDPTINKIVRPQRFFDTLLYTGNSSTQTITGLEFKPDFVWVKRRNGDNSHVLFDSVRGVHKYLVSSRTNVEGDNSIYLTSFNNGGFTSGNNGDMNVTDRTYVAWCWKAGGNSSTYNIDGIGYATAAAAGLDGGSLDPTGASINTESGFSILTYTGTDNVSETIAHGLGKKPAWIMVKARNVDGQDWIIYNKNLDGGNEPATHTLKLNGYAAEQDLNDVWQDTEPTSSLFTIGTEAMVNHQSGHLYVAYCWAEIPGFSKFGVYTGNGSSEGTYVELGFRPAFVMTRGTHGTSWYIYDNKRNTSNVVNLELNANNNQTEATFTTMDFLASGFKLRTSNDAFNYNNYTYVYMAFAEHPGTTSFDTISNAR